MVHPVVNVTAERAAAVIAGLDPAKEPYTLGLEGHPSPAMPFTIVCLDLFNSNLFNFKQPHSK